MINDEDIKDMKKYAARPEITRQKVKNEIERIFEKTGRNMTIFSDKFPSPSSHDNKYKIIENIEWTSSFWTGILWLCYELTGEKKYLDLINRHIASYKRRVEEKICTDTHDLGFLYSLSCVPAWKLLNDGEAKNISIKAANLLINRYLEKAGIIQAWGDLNNENERGRMIIDCCMNLPLLYWTSSVTGNDRYREIAVNHVKNAAKYLIREDASSYHTYFMDPESGMPKYGKTNQGYSDSSCWARGQAWAVYGFILSYDYILNPGLMEIAKKTAAYFLNRLPADHVCYWDLAFTEGDEERDSSAAAIACCGLLEISKHMTILDPLKELYENAALYIVNSLMEHYASASNADCDGLLLHSVYSKPANQGVDECTIWGDYFYFEALARLYKDWQMYW